MVHNSRQGKEIVGVHGILCGDWGNSVGAEREIDAEVERWKWRGRVAVKMVVCVELGFIADAPVNNIYG